MINQVLDDVVAVGSEGESTVNAFYNVYRSVSNTIGVSLADESDHDRAFRASHEGNVLGIYYNIHRSVWGTPEDKLIPLLWMLNDVKESAYIETSQNSAKPWDTRLQFQSWQRSRQIGG